MDSVFQAAKFQIWFGNETRFRDLLQNGLSRQTADAPFDAADVLITAVNRFEGTPVFLKLLLEFNFPLNLPDRCGDTAFMAAAGFGRVEAMQLLLAAGADPFWNNEQGANAASRSLVCGDPHCSTCGNKTGAHALVRDLKVPFQSKSEHAAKMLLEAGKECRAWHLIPVMEALGVPQEPLGWNAFMLKIAIGSAADVEVAQLAPTELLDKDAQDRSAFLLSIQAGRLDLAKAIHSAGYGLGPEEPDRIRAMRLAVGSRSIEMIGWLLSLGISIESRSERGETPLMHAVELRETAIVDFLLKEGADVHARDNNGAQAIHKAWGVELLQGLIKAGADVMAKDNQGYQPIHGTTDMEQILLLLDAGADVNAISGGGSWILDDIASQGDVEGVRLLLGRGAKPDLTAASGNTALFNAVLSDNPACVEVLLNAGSEINAMDIDGWTCLANVRSLAMAQYLLQRGADPAATSTSSLAGAYIPKEVINLYQFYRRKDKIQNIFPEDDGEA